MRRMVAIVVALVAAAGCSGPGSETRAPEGASASRLIYVRRTTLMQHDLRSDRSRTLAKLPTGEVDVSRSGDRYAVVEDRSPSQDAEGYVRPVIRVGRIDGGTTEVVGPGRSPRWDPSGERVVAVVAGRSCPPEAATCDPRERVVGYGVGSGTSQELLGPAVWSIVDVGSSGVAAIDLTLGAAVLAGEDGVKRLDVPPGELWGLSPVEAVLLRTSGDRAAFQTPDGETIRELDAGGALADGTWSPDGDAVAAVVLTGAARSELALIDVGDATLETVPGGGRAQGNVVWSEDSSEFAYVRTDAGGRKLTAVVCEIELRCRELFSWRKDVRLLALAPG